MIASELARELERITAPVTNALKVQEDQIEGLLIAQYNFTITIGRLQDELEAVKAENRELWEKLHWKEKESV
jgi:hypothetical protein